MHNVFQVMLLDGKRAPGNMQIRRTVKVRGERLRLDRSAHKHDMQRRVTCKNIPQQQEQKVRVGAPLMHFVHNDMRHRLQVGIRAGRESAKQNTCRGEEEATLFARAPLTTNRITHLRRVRHLGYIK